MPCLMFQNQKVNLVTFIQITASVCNFFDINSLVSFLRFLIAACVRNLVKAGKQVFAKVWLFVDQDFSHNNSLASSLDKYEILIFLGPCFICSFFGINCFKISSIFQITLFRTQILKINKRYMKFLRQTFFKNIFS